MVTSNQLRRQLRDILAVLYPDAESAKRVAYDAGLNVIRIVFDTKAVNYWHNILDEATNADRVQSLVDVALAEYTNHVELRNIYKEYCDSVAQKSTASHAGMDKQAPPAVTENKQLIKTSTFIPPAQVQCPKCGNLVSVPKFDKHWDNEITLDPKDYHRIWTESAEGFDSGWDTQGTVICPVCKAQHPLVIHEIKIYIDKDFVCPSCHKPDHLHSMISWTRVDGSYYVYQFKAKITCLSCQEESKRRKTVRKLPGVASILIGKLRTLSRQVQL